MEQAAWLKAAWAEFGVREIPGAASEMRISGYFRDCGHGEITSDAVPWCAAFVGAMLKRAGFGTTGSLMARSYLEYGQAMATPVPGAIAVLSRGTDPSAGHCGFYLGSAEGQIILLGGNQGDAVTVEAFPEPRLLGFRWPPGAEAPDGARPAAGGGADLFPMALRHVLEMEGGFSDDPYDPGGPTNRGITLAVFARWRGVTLDASSRARLIGDLKRIDDQTVADIYKARYWQPASCALLPKPVAAMHFDAAVNHGVTGAARLLQAALGVPADGEIGPQTLGAVRAEAARTIVERYGDQRRARYRALPQFWRFGRGWLKRVDATEAFALTFADAEISKVQSAKGVVPMEENYTQPLPGQIPGEAMPGTVTQAPSSGDGKWWLESKTVWGTLITALSTVLPVIGPLFGINLPAEIIQKLGDQTLVVLQAVGGLIGTLMAIYGRSTAQLPLVRRQVSLKM